MKNSMAKLAISGMRKVLVGKTKEEDCWDNKLLKEEKAVLLIGAKLNRNLSELKWETLSSQDRNAIYSSAKRASMWASKLGLLGSVNEANREALDYEKVA